MKMFRTDNEILKLAVLNLHTGEAIQRKFMEITKYQYNKSRHSGGSSFMEMKAKIKLGQ